jgi:exodeoxyribonuclease VII small subunit
MNDLTFEQALKRLEEIVEALETEDLDLDKSLQFFEEGVYLSRHCNQQLQAAEKRIDTLLRKADGTLAIEPFTIPTDAASDNGGDTPAVESEGR